MKNHKLLIGDSVIARDSFQGYYYSGRITKFNHNQKALVQFDQNSAIYDISFDFIISKPSKPQCFAVNFMFVRLSLLLFALFRSFFV